MVAGGGKPDFIVSFVNNPDNILVIECKADSLKHESFDRKQPRDYAIDGALLYADYLKSGFNVLAVAVSGESKLKISSFLWLKNNYSYKNIDEKKNSFLKPSELENLISKEKEPISSENLIVKAIEYNSLLHGYSIPEPERCTVISAILVALQDKPFLNSYKSFDYKDNSKLIDAIYTACERVLDRNKIDSDKREIIVDEYKRFKNNKNFKSEFIKKNKKEIPNTALRDLINSIAQDILPYLKDNKFDILGRFYTEFIKYAQGDKKTGLVLTPSHITDLFCELVDLDENDIVFDPCCGTGGFLVSAMNYMLNKVGNDSNKQKHIKSSQLLGIEMRSDMFSHVCSNMMMRGDGKSHIYYGNCFDSRLKEKIKNEKPTVSFLNPPYKDKNTAEQLEFVENALSLLEKNGKCVAICQFSTAISGKKEVIEVKERLLNNHSLEAVFSMPSDLFHPIGVITCILVFRAFSPHVRNKKVFFGYFKDDGFIKEKHRGRIDKNNIWDSKKDKWLKSYRNRESIAGLSVLTEVEAKDEWCAEAYMETDYSTLNEDDFIKTIKEYVAFRVVNE